MPELALTTTSLSVLYHADVDRFSTDAASLAEIDGRQTIQSRDIQFGMKLTLPGELHTHAQSEGIKAVSKYNESFT